MSAPIVFVAPGTVVTWIGAQLIITLDTPAQAEALWCAIQRCDKAGTTLEWRFGVDVTEN